MKKAIRIMLAILLVAMIASLFAACTPTQQDPCQKGHIWDEGTITLQPTCAAEGKVTFKCTVCGTTREESLPKSVQHTWNDGVVTKEATATEEGVITFTCTVCGQTTTQSIPKLETHVHEKGAKHETVPALCNKAGVNEYWDCTGCKAKLDADGNEVTDAQLNIPATGVHVRSENSVPRREPTCVEYGSEEYWTCVDCGTKLDSEGHQVTEAQLRIDMVAHVWDNGKIVKPATCTEDGEILYTCTVCHTYTMRGTIASSGKHTKSATSTPQVPATCTQEGTAEYWTCTECGKKLDVDGNEVTDAQLVLARVDHTYGELQPEQPATCTEDGRQAYYKCSECENYFDSSKQQTTWEDLTISASGHDWSDTLSPIDDSNHGYKCNNCDEYQPDTQAPHSLEYTNEGCTDGYHKQVCSECEYSTDEEQCTAKKDGKTAHVTQYGEDHGLNSEEWYADGDSHWKVCEHCGGTFDRATHDFNDYTEDNCTVCGHIHMEVEISYGETIHHVNSLKEAFAWIGEQQDKETTYTVRLKHDRSGKEDLTVPEGFKVTIELTHNLTLTDEHNHLIVSGEQTVLTIQGEGTLNLVLSYQSGTLVLPEGEYNIELNGVRCDEANITIGGQRLTHQYPDTWEHAETDGFGEHSHKCNNCDYRLTEPCTIENNTCSVCSKEYTVAEILKALAEDGELSGTYKLSGKITEIKQHQASGDRYQVQFSMDVAYEEGKTENIYCEWVYGDETDITTKLFVGTEVTVIGNLANSDNVKQFKAGAQLDGYNNPEATVNVTIVGVDGADGAATYDIKPSEGTHIGDEVTLTVTVNDPKYYVSKVTANGVPCDAQEDDTYKITLTAETVTIEVTLAEREQTGIFKVGDSYFCDTLKEAFEEAAKNGGAIELLSNYEGEGATFTGGESNVTLTVPSGYSFTITTSTDNNSVIVASGSLTVAGKLTADFEVTGGTLELNGAEIGKLTFTVGESDIVFSDSSSTITGIAINVTAENVSKLKATFEKAQNEYDKIKLNNAEGNVHCDALYDNNNAETYGVTFAGKQISHTYSDKKCSICGAEQPAVWSLVTSSEDLQDGDRLIFAYAPETGNLSIMNGSISSKITGAETQIASGTDSFTEVPYVDGGALIFTLKISGEKYQLLYNDGYLAHSTASSGKNTNFITSKSQSDTNANWTITQGTTTGAGTFYFLNADESNRGLLYQIADNQNKDILKFGVYATSNLNSSTSGTYAIPVIYRLPKGLDIVTETAPHKCNHVCPTCSKCTDLECGDPVCADKCSGHSGTGGDITPSQDITVTFTPSTSNTDGTTITLEQNVTILFISGGQASDFSSNGSVKVRQGKQIKISAPAGKYIKEVKIIVSSADTTNTFSATKGEWANGTWSGKEESITLTKDSGKQAVVTSITITFGD